MLQKGEIDKNLNIENNSFLTLEVDNKVKLPAKENIILIKFNDDLSEPIIDMSEYLWDMLISLSDQELKFTKKVKKHKLEIIVSMEEV